MIPSPGGIPPNESSMSPALKHIKGVVRLPTASLQRFAEARPIYRTGFLLSRVSTGRIPHCCAKTVASSATKASVTVKDL